MRPIIPGKSSRPPFQTQPNTGFPSPAEDYEEPPLDLHDLVVTNPLATYFMRADTDRMRKSGIQPGDILTVDRSLPPTDGCLVIAIIDDAFQVKWYKVYEGRFQLSDDHSTLDNHPEAIWGVVTYITRKL